MRWKTFVLGWGFALSLLLFAQHNFQRPEQRVFTSIIDMTHSVSENAPNWDGRAKALTIKTTGQHDEDGYFSREITLEEHTATHLDAPAHMMKGTWTVDQIPPERLVRPLAVLDVREQARANSDYQVRVEDIAAYETQHGEIPPGAVVIANTGWDLRWHSAKEFRNADSKGTMHFPGFSAEAARFLVEARNIVGLGIDTLSVDPGNAPEFAVHKLCAAKGVYHLEAVANVGRAPASGAIAVVTPMKIEGGSGAPARVLALVK